MVALAALVVADPPELWRDLGFVVDEDGIALVGGVRLALGAGGSGVRAWALRGLSQETDEIDGLASGPAGTDPAPVSPAPPHPNGVVALDHLVVATPDLDRTIAAIGAAGIEMRRVRDAGSAAAPTRQAFFRVGEVVLEVVGPVERRDDGPARFWGLAWTVRDLAGTAAFLGDRLRPAKDAVQRGRRIATLERAAGSTVPHAFLSGDR